MMTVQDGGKELAQRMAREDWGFRSEVGGVAEGEADGDDGPACSDKVPMPGPVLRTFRDSILTKVTHAGGSEGQMEDN
jgi:hypothetical protein